MKKYKRNLFGIWIVIFFIFIWKQDIKAEDITDVTASVSNETEERNTNDQGAILAYLNDELKVNFSFDLSSYKTNMSLDEEINKFLLVIPKGLEYCENSFVCEDTSDGKSVILSENTEYEVKNFQQISLYMDPEGKLLFFASPNSGDGVTNATDTDATPSDDEFYLLDGSLFSIGTLENAIVQYNEKYGSAYVSDGITETTDSDIMLVELKKSDYSKIDISCKTVKNKTGNSTGVMECYGGFVYQNRKENTEAPISVAESVSVYSYGITLTLCDGENIENVDDTTEVLANAKRLSDAVFSIYSYVATYAVEDTDGLQQAIDMLGENAYYTIPTEDASAYKLYQYVADFTSDSNGEAFLEGLIPQEYIVIESSYPVGYETSCAFLCIEEGDWTDEQYMEGGYIFHVLWLNFPGLYLPNTGESGIYVWQWAGILIVLIALGLKVVLDKK